MLMEVKEKCSESCFVEKASSAWWPLRCKVQAGREQKGHRISK